MVPTLNHYGIWVPCAIDQPLPLVRPGDTTRFNLDGLDIQAIFAPGHSFDTVVYVLNLAGRRVFLTGDIGFHGNNNILNRCCGDAPKARAVMKILREQVLPLKPEFVLTGHDEHTNGVAFLEAILRTTEEALHQAEARRIGGCTKCRSVFKAAIRDCDPAPAFGGHRRRPRKLKRNQQRQVHF